jgi:hypothetical protein
MFPGFQLRQSANALKAPALLLLACAVVSLLVEVLLLLLLLLVLYLLAAAAAAWLSGLPVGPVLVSRGSCCLGLSMVSSAAARTPSTPPAVEVVRAADMQAYASILACRLSTHQGVW